MSRPAFQWNIPNALSLLRIALVPVMIVLALVHNEALFITLFVFAIITDILDGLLARMLHQESEMGVLLDSYGDAGTYAAAVTGLCVFHPEVFHPPYAPWTFAFVGLYALDMLIGQLKWGRLVTGMHLYSAKATGYLQGAFLFVLFLWKLVPAFFFVMIIFGMLSLMEGILINLRTTRPALNAKGLYWMIKEHRLK